MNPTQKKDLRLTIEQLTNQANVCGLGNQENIPVEIRGIVMRADKEKRSLSRCELSEVCARCKSSEHAVSLLMRKSANSIGRARGYLLKKQPQLLLPGGELYPEHRAQACWRDCEQFMRVVIYGVACNCEEVTDEAGMNALAELYHLLGVPVSALLCLLDELRNISTGTLTQSGYIEEATCLSNTFDRLINALKPIPVLPSKAHPCRI